MIGMCLFVCLFQGPFRGEPFQPSAVPDFEEEPRYVGLLIGFNNYRKMSVLRTSESDIEALQRILAERFGFERLILWRDDRIQTRADIQDELDELVFELHKNDRLLIYFAGHGVLERDRYYAWCPPDADPASDGECLRVSDVVDWFLNNCPVDQGWIISDSCFAGNLLDAGQDSRGFAKSDGGTTARKSLWILTSTNITPAKDLARSGRGRPAKHSPFAQSLLEYLRTTTVPYVSPKDAYAFISRTIGEMNRSEKRVYQQLPKYGTLDHRELRTDMPFELWNRMAFKENGEAFPAPWLKDEIDQHQAYLGQLKGRGIRVISPPDGVCSRLEKLGLRVHCDETARTRYHRQLITFCEEVNQDLLKALQQELNLPRFLLITPNKANPRIRGDQCGEFDEIILYY